MQPRDETDLAEAIAGANGPLRIIGGGTRPVGKPVAGEALSTAALTGIEVYEPGALTIVVNAGTPVAEVEAALAAENQRLAFEPMDHRPLLGTTGEPTIGGVVAANVSGPRRVTVGACRDFMLGVRFVTGEGQVAKNGGRVMKNVTGYDLVKLMTGSRGTLGVLTQVSLKVLPKPEETGVVGIEGLTPARAVEAMSAALGSPYDVSGAAHFPVSANDEPQTVIRVEGFSNSVAYRVGKLGDLLGRFGEVSAVTGLGPDDTSWRTARDVSLWEGGEEDVWRIVTRPSDAPGIVARLPEGAKFQLDWGGGLVWAACAPGTDLRARLGPLNGAATLVRASEATRAALPVFHPEPAPVAALSARLRGQFDPRGVLNPGLMG